MTLAEVRAEFQPGKICATSDAMFPDGSRMRALLDACQTTLASWPLTYGLGHCRLYIWAEPSGASCLRVEVFFDGPFVEVSWLENWEEAETLVWVRRESLRGPAEQAGQILERFLGRLGCTGRKIKDAEQAGAADGGSTTAF